MPPKKPAKATEPSKKTEQKKKDKVIEDKTFGLKNKKGAKQQKFIKHVHVQVTQGNEKKKTVPTEQDKAKALKDKKEKEKEELNMLFKPVQQTVGKGVDPKSVLCAFFKQNMCTKGDKCKFSHDLNINRKAEKRSVYEDIRDASEETMENWDIDKLTEVVDTKNKNKQPTTNIICKYFLDAVEKSTYGWFWECPNGEKCIYKHCLPPGYALKKDAKKVDKEDEVSLEELIEKERASLGQTSTKVTLESFLKWKERKKREKREALMAEDDRKRNEFKLGRAAGISGRQMFEFNPDLVGADEGDEDEAVMTYIREADPEVDDIVVVDIALENLTLAAQESDGTGTQIDSSSRLAPHSSPVVNGEVDECEGATGGVPNHIGEGDQPTDELEIDEDLFMDDPDLDDIDELDSDDND